MVTLSLSLNRWPSPPESLSIGGPLDVNNWLSSILQRFLALIWSRTREIIAAVSSPQHWISKHCAPPEIAQKSRNSGFRRPTGRRLSWKIGRFFFFFFFVVCRKRFDTLAKTCSASTFAPLILAILLEPAAGASGRRAANVSECACLRGSGPLMIERLATACRVAAKASHQKGKPIAMS